MQRKSETSSVGRSLGKMKKFESTSIVCLRRHFPRYRRFFRAFLSQEKKRKRGKQECGLSIKRLFDEKMLECCSVAPHSSKASLCPPSPQGEGSERGNIKTILYRLLTQTLSPKGKARIRQRMLATFPKGESKKEYQHNGTGEACLKGKARTWFGDEAFQEKESSPG